jgi:hypothetical protein
VVILFRIKLPSSSLRTDLPVLSRLMLALAMALLNAENSLQIYNSI